METQEREVAVITMLERKATGIKQTDLVVIARERTPGSKAWGDEMLVIVKREFKLSGLPGKKSEVDRYSAERLGSTLREMVAAGIEIRSVNGKPFLSGDIEDAIKLVETGGDWGALKTAPVQPMLKVHEVEVTVDAGRVAPIW